LNTGSMPFPGKELAQDELSRDSCYDKIRSEDRKEDHRPGVAKGRSGSRNDL
jgi:hypothetical protein